MATTEQEQQVKTQPPLSSKESASSASASSAASSAPPGIVMILGASGLDRLLTVPCYPLADSKVRTTSYYEMGGGNAANTAHTMALLTKAQVFHTTSKQQQQEDTNNPEISPSSSTSPQNVVIRLCTKVGDDDIGKKIVEELQMAGVDLSSSSNPLFHIAKGTTTGFTTIIVSETEHTRTCIYTPGSCGELTVSEAKQLLQLSSHDNDEKEQDNDNNDTRIMNKFFDNVIHFHSDARHTDVALFLARHAKQRSICVSVDVEKDRTSVALDQLLPLADVIFTNNGQPVHDYFHRMHNELLISCDDKNNRRHEEEQPQQPALSLHDLPPTETSKEAVTISAEDVIMKTYAAALVPSMFFTRWYNQVGKQVIVTQGNRGAMYICCDSIVETIDHHADNDDDNKIIMPAINNTLEMIMAASPQQEQQQDNHEHHEENEKRKITRQQRLQHTFSSSRSNSRCLSLSSEAKPTTAPIHTTTVATYSIQATGVLQNIQVVDTTGAGDAFMGAFLLFRILFAMQQHQQLDNNKMHQNCLNFASWVAGCKVQGPGARMTLPTARDVDKVLGTSLAQIQESLEQLIGPFQFS